MALRTAALVLAALAATTALAADRAARLAPAPANAADVPGGYASDTLRLTLRDGVRPGLTPDGRLTLVAAGAPDARLADLLASVGVRSIDSIFALPFTFPENAARLGMDRMFRALVNKGSNIPALAEQVARDFPHLVVDAGTDGLVTHAETIPNDPSFDLQYALKNTGQTVQGQAGTPGADIKATFAWDISTGSPNVTIAIVDTGIATAHPDIAPKLLGGRNFTTSNPDDFHDRHGHGTHCAGIAGAITNNSIGIAGVCWDCTFIASKVLGDSGSGQWAWVAAGVQWAADQRVPVISMSLGGGGSDPATTAAIQYALDAGALVVVAAGNTNGGSVIFPGNLPTSFTVSSTDNRDAFSTFSSRGPAVDISAPGTNVYSSINNSANPNGYAYLSGTSMATPHVAGLAGLIKSVNPALDRVRIREIIEQTAVDLGAPGRDNDFGHGRIDARRALVAARNTLCPADYNGDGQADFFDYLDFVAAFAAGDMNADFNGDGELDFFDYLDFVAAFAAGCP